MAFNSGFLATPNKLSSSYPPPRRHWELQTASSAAAAVRRSRWPRIESNADTDFQDLVQVVTYSEWESRSCYFIIRCSGTRYVQQGNTGMKPQLRSPPLPRQYAMVGLPPLPRQYAMMGLLTGRYQYIALRYKLTPS